jgi:coenzyme F420-0:L-glutamate ligase / coenzyme F420-1:gamma-L-glutamate ligase
MSLILTPLQHVPLIHHGDALVDVVLSSLKKSNLTLKDNDILVFAQKIISKAEGRAVNLVTVKPSLRAVELAKQTDKDPRLVELILHESNEVLRIRPGTIIVEHKLGFVCANAGIDHSNVAGAGDSNEEWVLLLPKDPDLSARDLQKEFQIRTGKRTGILIIDSHGRAWRNGTVGVAIGLAGIPGLEDLRGHSDLFDFKLRITQVGTADELAAAASLVMGQAAEGTPVVHARGFPYPLREGSLNELIRPKDQDLFR